MHSHGKEAEGEKKENEVNGRDSEGKFLAGSEAAKEGEPLFSLSFHLLAELIEVQLGILVDFTLTEKRQKRRRMRRCAMSLANFCPGLTQLRRYVELFVPSWVAT